MRRALELARQGAGAVSPNPMVGAVIAADGAVVGEGWHAELGGLHAEAAALADARERGADLGGATMYVTLEPCAHEGRQPACAPAIAGAGIGRVVIGSEDPTEKASGRGPAILRDEGVVVEHLDGPEAEGARLLNQPFRKHSRTGRPLVTLKSAASLDGRTATASGDSQWISSDLSRERVHRWRSEADAVAVGIGTVIADDPTLTARGVGATRQPTRVIFDTSARIPLDSRLVRTATEAPVCLIVGERPPRPRVDHLVNAGVEVIATSSRREQQIAMGLDQLGRRGVTSLLLEGGAELAGAFIDAGEVDHLELFVAPMVIGGSAARPLLAGRGADRLAEATRAISLEADSSGDDILLSARLREW